MSSRRKGTAFEFSRRDFLVMTGAVALGLTGCASSATKPTSPSQNPSAATPPAKARAKTIKIGMAAEPPNFDVYNTSAAQMRTILVYNVVESLVGTTQNQEITPGLAESWEKIDAVTTRFKLRRGVKFHNGEPFNAEAVALAVKTINAPPGTSQILGFISTIKDVNTVDEFTVDIITKEADPILLRRLYYLSIVAPKAFAANPASAANTVIGTGPYKFKEWRKGQAIVLEANPDYWGTQKPLFQTAEFLFRGDPSTRVAALRAGEVHLIETLTPELAKTFDPGVIDVVPGFDSFMLRLNTKSGPLADKRVRQAMAHAIDLNSIHTNIYLDFGADKPKGQMFNRFTFSYNPNGVDHVYDPVKAKQLLKEANAEGVSIELVTQSANRYLKDREVTEAVAFMLNEVGFKASAKFIEYSEWQKVIFELNKPASVITIGAGNELLDPDRILDAYGTSKGRLSTYSNPRFDELMAAQRREEDPAKRVPILQQLSTLLHEEVATIPLAMTNLIYARSANLRFTPRNDGLLPLDRIQLS